MANQPFKDLREFAVYLDKRGLLRRVTVPVNPVYELMQVVERTGELERGGPALLFENVNGASWQILTNLLGSTQRVAWGLGLNELSELDDNLASLLSPAGPLDLGERLARLGETSYLARYTPKIVRSGPCQEVSLPPPARLPLLTTADGKQSWSGVLLLSRPTPNGPTQAAGGVLVGIGDELFLEGLSIEPGQSCPAAVVVGGDPLLLFAAQAPLLPTIDPLTLAGALGRRRVEMVRGKAGEVEVPALAEVVLEGRAWAEAGRIRFEPSLLTHRKEPLLLLSAPQEAAYLVKASERLLTSLLKQSLPEIVALTFPAQPNFEGLALVAIRKSYAGQAQRVMYGLWGVSQLRHLRHIVVVDADCDMSQPGRLLSRLMAELDPAHDLLTVTGPLADGTVGSKLGFDATRTLAGEIGHQPIAPMLAANLAQVRQLVSEKWLEYGIE